MMAVSVASKRSRGRRSRLNSRARQPSRFRTGWRLRRNLPGPDEPLLTNQLGERYGRSALYQAVLRWGAAAGIIRTLTNPHAIRHLWNFLAGEEGIDSVTRARLLNHSDTRTLQEYDHVLPQATAKAREQVRAVLKVWFRRVIRNRARAPELAGRLPQVWQVLRVLDIRLLDQGVGRRLRPGRRPAPPGAARRPDRAGSPIARSAPRTGTRPPTGRHLPGVPWLPPAAPRIRGA